MYLIPVPASADHYLWLLHDGKRALAIDPGNAEPVLRTLAQHGLQLESILVTHHHADHTAGHVLPASPVQDQLVNPFLRTRQAPIMAAIRHFDASASDDNTVFAAIRQWKNQFK